MPEHKLIERANLNAQALNDIKVYHRMTCCPMCAKELVGDCHDGQAIPCKGSLEYGTHQYAMRHCPVCSIVWELHLMNWTDERGDGMVTSEGHSIELSAFANCFCRKRLFGNGSSLAVHLNSNGHASLALGMGMGMNKVCR